MNKETENMSGHGYIDFAAVRAALDFPLVLQHYGIDFPAGRTQLKINCPFHDDTNPSCGVNTDKKAFNCFSCGTKGNILEFVTLMEDENPDDMNGLKAGAVEAIKMMGKSQADFAKSGNGAQKPKTARSGVQKKKRPSKAVAASQSSPRAKSGASEDVSKPSTDDSEAVRDNPPLDLKLTLDPEHQFFDDHCVTDAMVETFGLGYCNRGIMKGRACIPIHDEHGQLVAYAGRYANEEVPKGTERYKLPKRFLKSLVLFNLHRASEIGGRHLTIVEGYWSAMRLHLLGIPVVAVMGTSISVEQAALIAEYGFRFVTVIFDGDEAGQAGLDQSLPILARHVYARALELDSGVKPDSMSEKELQALRPAAKKS